MQTRTVHRAMSHPNFGDAGVRTQARRERIPRRVAMLAPFVAVLAACRPGQAPGGQREATVGGNVTVFAAASLTAAFQEMAASMGNGKPGTHVAFNFGGSPTLRTQLAQGARADVFASADEPNMQGAEADGTIAGKSQIFAQNKLVVIVPAANPAGIHRLQDLARPGIKLVLAQAAVPVGNYARQAFAKLSKDAVFGAAFATQAARNVVSDEADVKGVVAKVQLGEADAGVVYQTDVTAAVRPKVTLLAIPDQFNVIANYPIASVKGAPNMGGGQAFIAYVLSPAGQKILADYGFGPAPHG